MDREFFYARGKRSESMLLWAIVASLIGCARPLPRDVAADVAAADRIRSMLEAEQPKGEAKSTEVAKPTGFATLRGKFKLVGQAPSNPNVNVSRDSEICAPGGAPVQDQVVRVGSDGGLANVLIHLATKVPSDEWIHPSFAASASDTLEFDQKACVFLTRVVTLRSTQKLKVLNSDPVGHNTNITASGAQSMNVTIPSKGFAIYEPKGVTKDIASVSCSVHPWMKAHLFTQAHPYFAVSHEDGTFEIANMPAGVDIELRVWHEKTQNVSKAKVNNQDQKWNRGRWKLKLEPDQDAKFDIELDAALFQ